MKLHTLGCLLSLMAVVATASPARAITYQWPVLNSVDVTLTSKGATYHLTWSAVTVDDPTIDNVDPWLIYYIKTGITSGGRVVSAVRHRHKADFNYITGGSPVGVSVATSLQSFTGWARDVTKQAMAVQTIDHIGSNGNECVGLIVGPRADVSSETWEKLLSQNWDGGVGGAAACLGTPPANEWCALTTPSVTLDYGALRLSDASGARAVENVGVECTAGMKYTLRLRGVDKITLSNGMSANLTAGGQSLNSTLEGVQGIQTVELASTLAGTPTTEGPFDGNAVLFVSYP